MPIPNHFLSSFINEVEKENALNLYVLKDSNKKDLEKLDVNTSLTPRTFKRVISRENFMTYQWAWTL